MNAMSFIPASSVASNVLSLSEAAAKVLETKQSGVREALNQLERLEHERKQWECDELESARQSLYAMLTECYSFYLVMKTHTVGEVRDQHKQALTAFLEAKGLAQSLANSHDMSRIVRAIFGVDRRRVSAYSIALRKALECGGLDSQGKAKPLAAAALASWLAEQGGVEEVRLGGKNSGMTAKQRAEVAQAALKDAVLMRIKPDPKTVPFGVDDTDRTVLLVAVYRPTGELEVSTVVKNDTAVRAALAAHYSADKEAVLAAAQKAGLTQSIAAQTAVAIALDSTTTAIAA
jgi:hypothetical protein